MLWDEGNEMLDNRKIQMVKKENWKEKWKMKTK